MKITANQNLYLPTLLREVRRGNIAPAAFQRGYAWKEQDVLNLVQSISSGYPVGSIMIWNARATDHRIAVRNRLGPIVLEADKPEVGVILDGQNRLASLAWLTRRSGDRVPMHGLSPQEFEVWARGNVVAINLPESIKAMKVSPDADLVISFISPGDLRENNASHVEFSEIIDSRSLQALLRKKWDSEWLGFSEMEKDSMAELLDRVNRRFTEAAIGTTFIEDATPEDARRAFLRICKAGVPMSEADFNSAMTWDPGHSDEEGDAPAERPAFR